MKIGLFGGAFDPPHMGHKVVADSLTQNAIVDEIWFVPVFKHPWADRYGKHQLAEYDLRVHMLGMTIGKSGTNQKIVHYQDVSFTFDTLEYFSKKFPEHVFAWVMGSEYLSRFDDFLKGHPGLLNYHFYVYPRAGYPLDESLRKPNMEFLFNMPEVLTSSTQIKQAIKQKQSIEGLVTRPVADFITGHKLYL